MPAQSGLRRNPDDRLDGSDGDAGFNPRHVLQHEVIRPNLDDLGPGRLVAYQADLEDDPQVPEEDLLAGLEPAEKPLAFPTLDGRRAPRQQHPEKEKPD